MENNPKTWKPISAYYSNLTPEWANWLLSYLQMKQEERLVELAMVTMKTQSILIQLEDANKAVMMNRAKLIDEQWKLGALSALRFNQGCIKLADSLGHFNLNDGRLVESSYQLLREIKNGL